MTIPREGTASSSGPARAATAGALPPIADLEQRGRALDPRESFLVQAPAGSGKTELLTLRYLALLPQVDEPEQILAITFTRKATAQMRQRVLEALESARTAQPQEAGSSSREARRRLASAALEHAERRGWRLLEQPQRLNIRNLDSLALSIANRLPILSRFNGRLTPVDDAEPLYALAAERTMARLGDTDRDPLRTALDAILRLRDVRLTDCEEMIARMLAQRDQWLLALPQIASDDTPWSALREQLEGALRSVHEDAVRDIQARCAHLEADLRGLLELARSADASASALTDLPEHLTQLRDLYDPASLSEVRHWCCLCRMLMTQDGKWRSSLRASDGFPSQGGDARARKQRMRAIIDNFANTAGLQAPLLALRKLPPCSYSEAEAETLRSIFEVLRRALGELRVVFAEQGVIDFVEAGLGARWALSERPGVRMQLDEQIRHLLVDEFQDTSRPQFALLRTLLADWQPGDGRTCFLVGDPMQSIYLFRNAEPRLFGEVRETGIRLEETSLGLESLQLTTNFRSLPAIVDPVSRIFAAMLEAKPAEDVLAPAVSSRGPAAPGEDAVHLHATVLSRTDPRSAVEMRRLEAEEMLAVIRSHEAEMREAARNGGEFRIAILARSRSHLAAVIQVLQRERIAFRGVKIDQLKERQEILDLLSLLRALLHPADRIAWLAVLRAPWCGLTLPALHALCGEESGPQASLSLPELLRTRHEQLDPESRRRALHVLAILEQAQADYAEGETAASPAGLALWLERTWHALRAPSCLNAEQQSNCEALFSALATMPPTSFGPLDPQFERRLKDLFAEPDPAASDRVGIQMMTIHQAKGLEFEVVLVPQLDRKPPAEDPQLFYWMLEERPGGEEILLVAPAGSSTAEPPPFYRWLRDRLRARRRQEMRRLLYVAVSRAIREAHLFATICLDSKGELCPPADSLLAAGWAGLSSRVRVPARPGGVLPMPAPPAHAGVVPAMAAHASAPLQRLRRLRGSQFPETPRPTGSVPAAPAATGPAASGPAATGPARLLYREARIEGLILHALLEHCSLSGEPAQPLRAIDALARQYGLDEAALRRVREAVARGFDNTRSDQVGRWLLSAREAAWSESDWSAPAADGAILRLRPDRVFLGGQVPCAEGTDCLWIVDYKTAAPGSGGLDELLASSRERYRAQLERYSALFRSLGAADPEAARRPHRLALYHPMVPQLDWWPA